MKFIIVLLIVISGASAYLYLNPDVWQPWVKGTPLEPAPTTTHLYKWKDEHGQWQVADQPPTWDIPYQNLEYSSGTNIVPSIPVDDD